MLLLNILFVLLNTAGALEYTQYIYDGQGRRTDLNSLMAQVQTGDVVIVGEKHGFFPHHEVQKSVIESLQKLGFRVDVGMEHVPYTLQKPLEDYVAGQMSEEAFLKLLRWQNSPYNTCLEYSENKGYLDPFVAQPLDCYTPSLRLAYQQGGSVRAINLPRSITGKVRSQGIASLTPEEKELLPPNYQWGSPSYFERFRDMILSFGDAHGPISETMIENMFWAQSLWDEAMSWQSLSYMQQNPNGVMVIIVGDFHAAYSDGLAARFYARGAQKVHVISQSFVERASPDDIEVWSQPDAKYGPLGDLVIFTNLQ